MGIIKRYFITLLHPNRHSSEWTKSTFKFYAETENIRNTQISVKINVTLNKKPKAQGMSEKKKYFGLLHQNRHLYTAYQICNQRYLENKGKLLNLKSFYWKFYTNKLSTTIYDLETEAFNKIQSSFNFKVLNCLRHWIVKKVKEKSRWIHLI